MFWSWIRNLVASNSFVQQFTNHYYSHRSENVENAQGTPRMESTSNHSKNSSKDCPTAYSNISSNTNRSNQQQSSSNANNNSSNNANTNVSNNARTPSASPIPGNKRKQPDETTANKLKNKSAANHFDNGSGACLDNLRKLLNLNSEDEDQQPVDSFMLLGRSSSRPQSRPVESFNQTWQNWLADYRSMQQRGKQKLDQVKESLHQLKEYKREGSLEQPELSSRKMNATKAPPIISFESNENRIDQEASKLIKNKFMDKNLIDFGDSQWREQQQIREQVFEQIIGQAAGSQFSLSAVQNLIAQSDPIDKSAFNSTVFQQQFNSAALQNCKTNLSINSELMNQIKVSQAQSYHQQLNVCSGGTPVSSFRAQVKRSSYPSGLRTTALRIGPRLNRDKSRSRLVCLWLLRESAYLSYLPHALCSESCRRVCL